jgi:hypothetical protein
MLIASCDIETTGLDPSYCQVLEVGLILWDTTDLETPVTELPSFHCYVLHDQTVGEPYALAMNQRVLERIAKREAGYVYLKPQLVGGEIKWFLKARAPGTYKSPLDPAKLKPTGFNFDSFDRQFLALLPSFPEAVSFHHRSLSPATLFFNPFLDGEVPGSDEVFRRAGVTVADRHTALGDAQGVIEVLRAAFRGRGPSKVPAPPRCPTCGGRQSITAPMEFGQWLRDIPCPVCSPGDSLERPLNLAYAPDLALVG